MKDKTKGAAQKMTDTINEANTVFGIGLMCDILKIVGWTLIIVAMGKLCYLYYLENYI